jgi:hypothetical protein
MEPLPYAIDGLFEGVGKVEENANPLAVKFKGGT